MTEFRKNIVLVRPKIVDSLYEITFIMLNIIKLHVTKTNLNLCFFRGIFYVFYEFTLGISNVVGRILSGFVSDRPWADAVILNNGALILGGALTCCLPWLPSFPFWATYSALYGLCIGK